MAFWVWGEGERSKRLLEKERKNTTKKKEGGKREI